MKFQTNIKKKWAADNENVNVSQKKSDNRSLCIWYLKVIEEQVSLSTLLGTLRVYKSTVYFSFAGVSPAKRCCNFVDKIVLRFPVNKIVPSFGVKLIKQQQQHITMGQEFLLLL